MFQLLTFVMQKLMFEIPSKFIYKVLMFILWLIDRLGLHWEQKIHMISLVIMMTLISFSTIAVFL